MMCVDVLQPLCMGPCAGVKLGAVAKKKRYVGEGLASRPPPIHWCWGRCSCGRQLRAASVGGAHQEGVVGVGKVSACEEGRRGGAHVD